MDLSFGSRMEDAQSVFGALLKEKGLSDKLVSGFDEKIELKLMNQAEGWLTPWMMKSDEIAALLTGARLWDVYYVRNYDAMRLMSPVSSQESQGIDEHIQSTYEAFPLAIDLGVPDSLRYAICNLSLDEMLIFEKDNTVDICPTRGFYNLREDMESGEPLPFQSMANISGIALLQTIVEINNSMKKEVLEHDKRLG